MIILFSSLQNKGAFVHINLMIT